MKKIKSFLTIFAGVSVFALIAMFAPSQPDVQAAGGQCTAGNHNIVGGVGQTYKEDLYFFDWSGQTIGDGATSTKTLTDGTVLTATIKNSVYVNNLYPDHFGWTAMVGNPPVEKSCTHCTNTYYDVPDSVQASIKNLASSDPADTTYQFDVEIKAEKNGQLRPVEVVVSDGEESNTDFTHSDYYPGWVDYTTDSQDFTLLEEFDIGPGTRITNSGQNAHFGIPIGETSPAPKGNDEGLKYFTSKSNGANPVTITTKFNNGTQKIQGATFGVKLDCNNPPVADDDTETTGINKPVTVDILSNDSDSDGNLDTSTIVITKQPDNGTLTVNADGTVTYTPDAGYTGTDTFKYTVKDNEGLVSNEATGTITITDNPPVITTHDTTVAIGTPVDLLSLVDSVTDVEDDTIAVNATNVQITNDGGFDPNVAGTYTVTYSVTDSDGNTTTETAQITVDGPPTITTHDAEILKGDTLDLLTLVDSVTDVEDGPIDVGEVIMTSDGGFDPNVPGTYTITYQVTDLIGNITTETAEVKVKYANVFDPPSARKTVTNTHPEMEWKMVWINDGNAPALNTQVLDPIPANTTYVTGSIMCDARGASTTTVCTYDSAENRVRWEGNIAQDPGGTNEADSANEVVIIFKTTVPPEVDKVENQAEAYYDRNADGSFVDDKTNGQNPILTDNSNSTNFTNDPTVWSRSTLPTSSSPTESGSLAETGSSSSEVTMFSGLAFGLILTSLILARLSKVKEQA